MDILLHFYMFFGALFSLIISMGQLFQKKKVLINYIYSFSFAGLGFWLFQISMYATGVFTQYYVVAVALIPVTFIVPPLMVLRYKWIISSRFEFKPAYYLLFIPAFLTAVYVMAPLIPGGPSFPEGYASFKPILENDFVSLPLYFKILYSLYVLPKIYLVISMSPSLIVMAVLWRRNRHFALSSVSKSGYIFAALIVLSNVVAIVGDFLSAGILKFSVVMANTTMCFLYMVTQRHPNFNRLLKSETRKAQYEHSKISGLDVTRITDRLYEIMEEEKAFADEDLTLKNLAGDLGISPHQLSEILNEKIRKNFNSFVNEYRIAEAKKLLQEEPDRSLLSIGVAVGFNSNTTFITVFSKFTGMSPGQYRRVLDERK